MPCLLLDPAPKATVPLPEWIGFEGAGHHPEGIDALYDTFTEYHINGPEDDPNGNISNVARINSTRHGEGTGSNALFIDGHVDIRLKDTLKELGNWDDRTYNRSLSSG